jgi:hypothetical protein
MSSFILIQDIPIFCADIVKSVVLQEAKSGAEKIRKGNKRRERLGERLTKSDLIVAKETTNYCVSMALR